MMEKMSAAQVTSLDGVHIGEYEGEAGVNSMMALMTQQEPQTQGGGESIMTSVPSLYPTFQGLMSGATAGLFSAEKLQQQLASAVSSVPFMKTEGCPNLPNRFELQREQAVNAFRDSVSMQPLNRTVKSLDASAREGGSSHFTGSRTLTAATDEEEGDALKAKILAHPRYPCLLEAYIDCQKVGAGEEVVAYLESIWKENKNRRNLNTSSVEMDPELDRFMEAYCVMLRKYQEELAQPFKEAMAFINNIETQLNSLCNGAIRISPSAGNDEKKQVGGSSDEEYCSTGEMDYHEADHHSEDRELKEQLLRKYSGYLSSLKQEFMKRKKKGKLPKDARQKLLDWWNLHYKWPYPSENEKIALAEATSLDQKQINNWFINQRKRHWKPSEDMQFVVMDSQNPHGAGFYVDRHLMNQGSAFHLDC